MSWGDSGQDLRVEFQGSFRVSSVEGSTMPVFTFEKISPPIRRAANAAPAAEKPRSVIVQILDRLAEARGKRVSLSENARQPQPRKAGK
jgi:hypothetical protein